MRSFTRSRQLLTSAAFALAIVAASCASAPPDQATVADIPSEPLNYFPATTEEQTPEQAFNSVAAAIDAGPAETSQTSIAAPTTVDKQAIADSLLTTTAAPAEAVPTTAPSGDAIPTTVPGTAAPGSILLAAPFAMGTTQQRPASLPTDCDPAASFVTRPAQPVLGEPFVVRMDATSANGFAMLWWFTLADPRPADLNRSFRVTYDDAPNHVWAEWSVTLNEPGFYSLGAQGRDVLYGTQPGVGEPGIGNQVSEGCGIPYLDIVID